MTNSNIGYKNSPLPTIEDKLLCILVHMQQNLTQAVQGQLFGMIPSDANKWLQRLRPSLQHALQRLDVVPARLAALSTDTNTAPPDHLPFFSRMVPNARSNDRSMTMNKRNTIAERRNVIP